MAEWLSSVYILLLFSFFSINLTKILVWIFDASCATDVYSREDSFSIVGSELLSSTI